MTILAKHVTPSGLDVNITIFYNNDVPSGL
jgi:hypothetical protein